MTSLQIFPCPNCSQLTHIDLAGNCTKCGKLNVEAKQKVCEEAARLAIEEQRRVMASVPTPPCKSCSNPMTYDPARYQGGWFCESRGCPAYQEIPLAELPMGVDEWLAHGRKHGYLDYAVEKAKSEGRKEGKEVVVKAVEEHCCNLSCCQDCGKPFVRAARQAASGL